MRRFFTLIKFRETPCGYSQSDCCGSAAYKNNVSVQKNPFSAATQERDFSLPERRIIKNTVLSLLLLMIPFLGNAQWTQLGVQLEGKVGYPNNNAAFGRDLAVSGDGSTVVVGASFSGGIGCTTCVSYAQIFRFESGNWVQIGEDIFAGEPFIHNMSPPVIESVAISHDGNTIAIGEPNYYTVYEDELTTWVGRLRIFNYNGTEWIQVGEDIMGVSRDSNGNYDLFETGHNGFGLSVALSADGKIVAVADGNSNNELYTAFSQEVRVFKNINDNWEQLGSTLSGEIFSDDFGTSIDLSGDGTTLIVGAPGGNISNAPIAPGYVSVYQLENNNWVLDETIEGLESTDGWGRGNFAGAAVSISDDGSTIAFTGPQYRNNQAKHVGNVRVFKKNSGVWQQVGNMFEGAKSSHAWIHSMIDLSADGEFLIFGTGATMSFWWDPQPSTPGKIQVFQNINNDWELVEEKLSDSDTDGFGQAVSISLDGSILGVGAMGAIVDGVAGTGNTTIYQNCSLSSIYVLAEVSEEFCSGSNTTLIASIAPEYYVTHGTVNWYEAEDETEPIFTGTEFETPELTETISYWVEAVAPTGCPSERVEVVVSVNPIPELIIANTELNTCEGATAILTASTSTGVINWYDSEDEITPIFIGTSYETPELTETTTYWVEAESESGCISERTEILITVLPAPILEAETTYAICSGNEASLYASSPSNVIFWYANEDDTEYLYHGNLFVTEVLTENTTYWVEAYNLATGCRSERIEVTIIVGEALSAPIAESTQLFVAGMTLADFEVEHTAPLTWYADAQLTQELPETTLVVAGTIYYVTQSGIGCESAATQVMADTFLGNGNLNSDKFAYYPNPVKDVLNFKGNETVKSAQVYDLNGKLILNQNSNSISNINLSTFPKGTYVVKVTTDKGVNTFKIVKS